MTSQKNINLVAEIKSDLEKAKSIVLADYSGLDVAAQNELRVKITETGGQVRVLKNRLFKVAVTDHLGSLAPQLDQALNNQTAFLFSFQDAVSAIKSLYEFADSHQQLNIKVGILDGKILTPEEVEALSKLPSKPELIAKLIGQIQAPVYGLVGVLSATTKNLVYVLDAIKQQKATN